MEKNNKKPVLFIGLLVIVFLTIGVTLAYYTTTDTFNNEFNTGNYSIETQEAFVSPDNWTPGTTTTKTVIATNKGNTPAAVRIKLTPSWEDKNGDPLPLTDGTNEAAIINFNSNLNRKWVYQDGYYYYQRALNENQSTTTLLNSVTFNPEVTFDKTRDCDTVNGVTTCTTTFNDYAGGKYTLKIDVETAQFDKYQEIWGTVIEVKDPILVDGTLKQHDTNTGNVFGKSIARSSFESITTVDNKNISDFAIDSWDCSDEQNETVMCWYTDTDNDSKFELYIGQEDGVKANPDSRYTFFQFTNVENMDLSNFDTSNVVNMYYMFLYAGYNTTTFSIVGMNNFDTSKVTNMSNVFVDTGANATTWSIGDLSGWDTSNVTNMSYLFYEAGKNATVWNVGNLGNWDVSKVTNMSNMFMTTAGVSGGTVWTVGDLGNWDVSNVEDMTNLFANTGANATTWTVGDLKNWNVSSVTTMEDMFGNAGRNATTWSVGDLSRWNTSSVTKMDSMFAYSGKNATIWSVGDLSGWNTSSVVSMSKMFFEAGKESTTFRSIGTLKVYASNISEIICGSNNFNGMINIYNNPTTYTNAFKNASTVSGSGITVNYTSATTNIDAIIATKSSNSNVVKGSIISN